MSFAGLQINFYTVRADGIVQDGFCGWQNYFNASYIIGLT
jgi:hypothetical protein